MADALVKWLSNRGYQPVLLPASGYQPPELYVAAKPSLNRLGPLKDFLPKNLTLPKARTGRVPDIQVVQTTQKSVNAAAKFLDNALSVWGITHAPGLDLSFIGQGNIVFTFTEASYEEVSIPEVARLILHLKDDALPKEFRKKGLLHVVYHYLYAGKLEMRRSDKESFQENITGVEIEKLFKLGIQGKVQVTNGNTLLFGPGHATRAAFAYKAGRIRSSGAHYELVPGEVFNIAGSASNGPNDSEGYLPFPNVLMRVENASARDAS